jgi:proteasome lid subunit RPN8/RPN11
MNNCGFRETAYLLVGFADSDIVVARRIQRRKGTASSVQLDSDRVLAREEKKGDVVGFWHTHPAGYAQQSRQDERTMAAFCRCFGKPLICVIECGREVHGWIHKLNSAARKVRSIRKAQDLVLIRCGRKD